jgi:hypothetical protein
MFPCGFGINNCMSGKSRKKLVDHN